MLEYCIPKASFLLQKNANLFCGACSSSVFLLEIFKWAISTQNNFDNKRILLTLKTIHVYFEARSTVNVIIAPASVLLFYPFSMLWISTFSREKVYVFCCLFLLSEYLFFHFSTFSIFLLFQSLFSKKRQSQCLSFESLPFNIAPRNRDGMVRDSTRMTRG